MDPALASRAQHEVESMRQLAHPNIAAFYASYTVAFDLWIVIEYFAAGSCKDIMTICRHPFTAPQIVSVLWDTLCALKFASTKHLEHS